MKITFNDSINKAQEFLWTCQTFRSPIDLIVDKHYVIDGKSALGVFAYAGGHELEAEIKAIDTDELNRFTDVMKTKFSPEESEEDMMAYTE